MDKPRLTQAAFARHMGVDKAHVTRLKHAGRLVMVDGLVDVAASERRIAQTAGTRDDVARRHAEGRAAMAGQGAEPHRPANPPAGAANAAPDDPQAHPSADRPASAAPEAAAPTLTALDTAREQKILAESRRVQAAAAREELELARARGDVIAREDVDAALRHAGAAIRGELERMADQLAPLVAPIADLEECRAAIDQAARDILARFVQACERQAAQLGRAA